MAMPGVLLTTTVHARHVVPSSQMKTACEELAATIDMQLKKVEDNVVRFTRSVASQATGTSKRF